MKIGDLVRWFGVLGVLVSGVDAHGICRVLIKGQIRKTWDFDLEVAHESR